MDGEVLLASRTAEVVFWEEDCKEQSQQKGRATLGFKELFRTCTSALWGLLWKTWGPGIHVWLL